MSYLVDSRGQSSPKPVNNVKQALQDLEWKHEGIFALTAVVDDENALKNIKNYAENEGYLVTYHEKDDGIYLIIRKSSQGTYFRRKEDTTWQRPETPAGEADEAQGGSEAEEYDHADYPKSLGVEEARISAPESIESPEPPVQPWRTGETASTAEEEETGEDEGTTEEAGTGEEETTVSQGSQEDPGVIEFDWRILGAEDSREDTSEEDTGREDLEPGKEEAVPGQIEPELLGTEKIEFEETTPGEPETEELETGASKGTVSIDDYFNEPSTTTGWSDPETLEPGWQDKEAHEEPGEADASGDTTGFQESREVFSTPAGPEESPTEQQKEKGKIVEAPSRFQGEQRSKVPAPREGLVYLITSSSLGQGDEELGRLLMRNFIYTIKETLPLPQKIIFMNRGVYLTTGESQVLDDLKEMADSGVEILSCGTCMDYYRLKDHLAVGEITNMYNTLENLRMSPRCITI